MRFLAFVLTLLALGFGVSAPASASSHGGIYAALEVPALEHGQLAAYANARPEVLRLAGQLLPGNAKAETLVAFTNEHYATAWGNWLPLNLAAHENSPVHLPTHAYLAGTQALVQLLPQQHPDVRALINQIVADGGAALCQYSARTFRTDTSVEPDWERLPQPPTGSVSLLAMLGLLLFGWRRLRSRKHRMA